MSIDTKIAYNLKTAVDMAAITLSHEMMTAFHRSTEVRSDHIRGICHALVSLFGGDLISTRTVLEDKATAIFNCELTAMMQY